MEAWKNRNPYCKSNNLWLIQHYTPNLFHVGKNIFPPPSPVQKQAGVECNQVMKGLKATQGAFYKRLDDHQISMLSALSKFNFPNLWPDLV